LLDEIISVSASVWSEVSARSCKKCSFVFIGQHIALYPLPSCVIAEFQCSVYACGIQIVPPKLADIVAYMMSDASYAQILVKVQG